MLVSGLLDGANKMLYVLLLNNGESYEDFSEWVGGVFPSRKEAADSGKSRTISDYFNIEAWEVGKEKYNKVFTYEFSNDTRKWKI